MAELPNVKAAASESVRERWGRYRSVVSSLLRTSIQTQAQYRLDFILQLFMGLLWVVWNVLPLWLIFGVRPEIAGWSREEAMLVMSAFLVLKALLEGLVSPNLQALVEHLRTGTFDFVLMKPVDAQLMVSLSRVLPAKMFDLLGGCVLAAWSISRLDPTPSPVAVLYGGIMLGAGAVAIYSLWMVVICSAFWFVKVDNLSFLFTSIFDAARWPISMFRGWLRTVLTFVVPVAVMTSYPALAILGRLDSTTAAIAAGTAATGLVASRLMWRFALRHYASASS